MVASGTSIISPKITGLGNVRLRYPIPSTHVSGSTTQIELDALKELTLYPKKYEKFFPGALGDNGTIEAVYTFSMSRSTKTPPGSHYHSVELTTSQLKAMKYDKAVITVVSETRYGHDHELEIFYGQRKEKDSQGRTFWWIGVKSCDGMNPGKKSKMCWDDHIRTGLLCMECINNEYPV